MTEQVTKAYYLNETEFAVLLAVKGAEKMYGFKMMNIRNFEKSDMDLTLFGLVQKKIITVERNKITVNDEYDQILKTICAANRVLICSKKDDVWPEQCIYPGRQNVLLQLSGQNGAMIRLELLEREALIKTMIETGFQLENVLKNDFAGMQDEISQPKELQKIAQKLYRKKKESVLAQKEVTAGIWEIKVADGCVDRQVMLATQGMNDYILTVRKKEVKMYRYSNERLHILIHELTENC